MPLLTPGAVSSTMGALFWALKYQPPFSAIIKLGGARSFFKYNSDCICLKEESFKKVMYT